MSSAQTMAEVDSHKYFSHSQLSFRYGDAEIGGYNNAKGTQNDKGATYTGDEKNPENPTLNAYNDPIIISVEKCENSADLFAVGWGELHIYIPNTEMLISAER